MLNNNSHYRFIWFFICIILVFLIIIIGAYTRITQAGLSISYWKPITGLLPPITKNIWLEEFAIYKNFPEYKHINFDITLEEFKYIFLIEYIHRLLAKLIAIIYIGIGYYFFIYQKSYSYIFCNFRKLKLYFIITFCILLQGFIGWIMVKSGLDINPFVDHIKLAVHLLLGIVIFALILVQFFNYLSFDFNQESSQNCNNISNLDYIKNQNSKNFINKFYEKFIKNIQKNSYLKLILLFLFFTQIFLGGLMSGLHAGKIYATFPFMGNTIIPLEISMNGLNINCPVSIQFLHRLIGFILGLFIFYLASKVFKKYYKIAIISCTLIILQIVLGFASIYYYDINIIRFFHHIISVIIAIFVIIYLYIL